MQFSGRDKDRQSPGSADEAPAQSPSATRLWPFPVPQWDSTAFGRSDRPPETRHDGPYGAGASVTGLRTASRLDQPMQEGKLDDDGGRQHERIEIRQAHAAIDRVDRECEWQPSLDDALQRRMMRIEIDLGRQFHRLADLRPQAEAEPARR